MPPAIVGGGARGIGERALLVKVAAVEFVGQVLTGAPRNSCADGLPVGSAAGVDVEALRFRRAPGDDVDNTVDGVGTPQRRPRPTDHLDPVDVVGQHIGQVPIDSREQRGVDGTPVDQHQQLVRIALRLHVAVETASGDYPVRRAGLVDLQVRRETKHLRNCCRARADDVVAADDVDRGGRIAKRHVGLADRRNVDVLQVLDRHAAEGFDLLTTRRMRQGCGDQTGGKCGDDCRAKPNRRTCDAK